MLSMHNVHHPWCAYGLLCSTSGDVIGSIRIQAADYGGRSLSSGLISALAYRTWGRSTSFSSPGRHPLDGFCRSISRNASCKNWRIYHACTIRSSKLHRLSLDNCIHKAISSSLAAGGKDDTFPSWLEGRDEHRADLIVC